MYTKEKEWWVGSTGETTRPAMCDFLDDGRLYRFSIILPATAETAGIAMAKSAAEQLLLGYAVQTVHTVQMTPAEPSSSSFLGRTPF
jgi:hypothetical protein